VRPRLVCAHSARGLYGDRRSKAPLGFARLGRRQKSLSQRYLTLVIASVAGWASLSCDLNSNVPSTAAAEDGSAAATGDSSAGSSTDPAAQDSPFGENNAGEDNGTIDSWILKLTLPGGSCPAGPAPPPAPGLTASPTASSGIHLSWNVGTCPATNYHLVYGSLSAVSSYAITGGVCGLGPLGSYDWTGLPAGNLWFVVVSDNASTTEGSWGTTKSGQRNGTIASGTCGFSQRNNGATCP